MQIDKLTKTIYLATDNRGIIVAHPQYFKRVLPKKLTEGLNTSAYAQFQLTNGNVQINTGQVFGESKITFRETIFSNIRFNLFLILHYFKHNI